MFDPSAPSDQLLILGIPLPFYALPSLAVGAVIGSMLRHASLYMLPMPILGLSAGLWLVNLVGSLLVGLIHPWLEQLGDVLANTPPHVDPPVLTTASDSSLRGATFQTWAPPALRLLRLGLITGLCGALTTLSSLSWELSQLFVSGHRLWAFVQAYLHVSLGLASCLLGRWLYEHLLA